MKKLKLRFQILKSTISVNIEVIKIILASIWLHLKTKLDLSIKFIIVVLFMIITILIGMIPLRIWLGK